AFLANWGLHVAVDASGNVYAMGAFEGVVSLGGASIGSNSLVTLSTFVAKYSPAGVHLWSIAIGGASAPSASPGGLAIDSSGNVLVSVWTHNDPTPPLFNTRLYKLSSSTGA